MAGIQNPPVFLFSEGDEVFINLDLVTSIENNGGNPMFNFQAPSVSITITTITFAQIVSGLGPSLLDGPPGRYPNNKFIIKLDSI